MRIVTLLAVASILLGCVQAQGRKAQEPARFQRLTLVVSGGFAGVVREVRVDGKGRVRVIDHRRGICAQGRLDPAELDELSALADQVGFDRKNTPSDVFRRRCPDCMNYALKLIGARGEERSSSWTGGGGPERGPRQALVGKLAAWFALLESAGSRRDCQ